MIEIRRRFVPIGTRSVWQLHEYDRVVWRHSGRPGEDAEVLRVAPPDDYVLGLLVASVDGREVDVHDLDEALRAIELTRQDIERAIAP